MTIESLAGAERIRETTVLPIDEAAVRLWQRLEGELDAPAVTWPRLFEICEELTLEHANALIPWPKRFDLKGPVSGAFRSNPPIANEPDWRGIRYLSAANAVRLLVSSWPRTEQNRYAARNAPLAERELAMARERRNPPTWHALLKRHSFGPAAVEAIQQLAELAELQGASGEASEWWSRLQHAELPLDTIPSPESQHPGSGRLRWSVYHGDPALARLALEKEQAARLGRIEEGDSLGNRPLSKPFARTRQETNRHLLAPGSLVPRTAWQIPHAMGLRVRWASFPGFAIEREIPWAMGNRWGIFWQGGGRLQTADLQGNPQWGSKSFILAETTAGDNSLVQPATGHVVWQVASRHGLLICRMGWPMLFAGDRESHAWSTGLGCFDIASGEGRLLWQVHHDHAEGLRGWSIAGSPRITNDRVICCIAKKDVSWQLGLAAFNLTDGRLEWLQPICSLPHLEDAGWNRLGELTPEVFGTRVLLSTEEGAVVALNEVDGSWEWGVNLPHVGLKWQERSHPLRFGRVAPLVADGIVLIAPQDQALATGISTETGDILWQKTLPEPMCHSLGSYQNLAFFAGKGLIALNVHNGETSWRFISHEAEHQTNGGGDVCGELIVWPTHKQVWGLKGATGQPVFRIPCSEHRANVSLINARRMLVTTPQFISQIELDETVPADESVTAPGEPSRLRRN